MSGPFGPNVRPLTRLDDDDLAVIWAAAPAEPREVHPPRHVDGWSSVPCRCGVCRAERFVDRLAGVLVGVCIGYFGAHIAIAVIR